MVNEVPRIAATKTGFTDISALPGLASLWAQSQGDPRICVAVLDGPVDQSHPCFDGANLTRLPTLVSDVAGSGIRCDGLGSSQSAQTLLGWKLVSQICLTIFAWE